MSWLLRKRIPAQIVTGANSRIQYGLGGPLYSMVDVDPRSMAAIYAYHEGDLFSPGAQNFVFEPQFELPIQTIWGRGFVRYPNTFSPIQPQQVYANPQVHTVGLGGPMAGQIIGQPLMFGETGGG